MDPGDIAERVRQAYERGTPISIRGGGSKAFVGRKSDGEPLDVTGYRGIVDYDPAELVVTARCGTPVAELEAVLAERGQMLPFEPPHFAGEATVGGMIAAGLSGPRRPWSGSVRDHVLGTLCVSGRGELLRFGGRVMKNVAGYDVSRLMVGALGTLGVVLETSIKVLPVHRHESTRVIEIDEAGASRFMAKIGATPTPVSASCFHEGGLYLRLSGTEAGVRAGCRKVGGDSVEHAATFWEGIRNQTHEFFNGDEALWRFSLAPATPPLEHAGASMTEWGGALRWLRGARDFEVLAAQAAAHGGSVSLYRNGDRTADVYQSPDPVTRRLFAGLKDSFDPGRILNRGRLYSDL